METLETLRSRVETAEDLYSVARIMKTIAAISIRQYQEAVESVRTYSQTLELGFQILLRSYIGELTEVEPAAAGRIGHIAFGSDQGMCGPFNERMREFLLDVGSESEEDLQSIPTICVGYRLAGQLEMARIPAEEVYGLPGSASEISVAVDRLLIDVERWRENEGITHIYVHYHRTLSGANYRPRRRRVLPIDIDWLDSLRKKPWESNRLPIHRMPRAELLSQLVRQYLFIELFRAFAESLASENASRLASMQAAERNIEDRLDELENRYHRFRQESITQELLDIVSGYTASID